jgi:parallel beta-helix repeat protein
MKKKRSTVFVILILIVATLFILGMTPYRELKLSSSPREEREVWEITEEMVISNETIRLSKDLVIGEGGKLTLDNVHLMVNNSRDFIYLINVTEDGALFIFNSNITVNPENGTVYNSYEFKVYGEMEISNSSISYMGWNELGSPSGIQIYSDDVRVLDSDISRSIYSGIYIKEGSPLIKGNHIHHNWYGVYGENASPLITYNNISSNYNDGIQIRNNSSPEITGNTFYSNEYGISSYNSNFTSSGNFLNSTYGGYNLETSNVSIIDDDIHCIYGTGIVARDSQLKLENSEVISYSSISLWNAMGMIANNSLTGGVSIEGSSDVLIDNNSIVGIPKSWGNSISLRSSNGTISNNFITNLERGIYIDRESNASILNNIITDIEHSAIFLSYSSSYSNIWTELVNNIIINASVGIESSSRDLDIKNCIIAESRIFDLDLYYGVVHIINTSYNENKVDIRQSTIIHENYLDLNVVDIDGGPVVANVTLYDTDDNLIYETISDSNGQVSEIPLIYSTQTTHGITYHGPYRLVLKNGNNEIVTSVSVEENRYIEIKFDSLGDIKVEPGDISLSKEYVEDNETTNITALIHNIGLEVVENVSVEFSEYDNNIGSYFIDRIDPGSSETASINWTAHYEEVVIKVKVNSESEEVNKMGNNFASKIFQVYGFVIDSYETYSDQVLEFDKDIVIAPGGRLELTNVSIIMNSTYQEPLWNVTEGGELYLDKSNISIYKTSNPFDFRIYGKAILNDSHFSGMELENSWWWYGAREGISIFSDDVIISNNTIGNSYYGITCMDSSPIIYNNNIIDFLSRGIYCLRSNATISSNNIHTNSEWGDGLHIESSRPLISNNTIFNNNYGAYLLYSEAIFYNNTFKNNTNGLWSFSSEYSLNNNVLIENEYGIEDISSSVLIIKNQIINNDVGIQADRSEIEIIDNTIANNEFGIKIGWDRYWGSSWYNTEPIISMNLISNNNKTGIAFYGSSPKIINNTIGANKEWGIHGIDGNATFKDNDFEYEGEPNEFGRILQEYTLNLWVTDTFGRLLDDVKVNITIENGSNIVDTIVGEREEPSESMLQSSIPGYVLDNNGENTSFEYLVKAEQEGFSNSSWVYLNESKELTIRLNLLPDLEITEVEVGKYFNWYNDYREPAEGDKITIRIHVGNSGAGSSFNISVRTLIDGKLMDEQEIPGIHSGKSQSIEFDWVAEKGNHTFEAIVDPENTIEESNETNNRAESNKQFDPLPEDLAPINTILIICLIILIISFIFWIRWRYEVWR